MLDTVDDLILLIAENNIAVFSHELDDQKFTALITHFIQMLNLKTENTLHGRLSHCNDTAAADVLTEKHTEIWGSQRTRLIGCLLYTSQPACKKQADDRNRYV